MLSCYQRVVCAIAVSRSVQSTSSPGHVDLVRQLGNLGKEGHGVVLDRQEAAVHCGRHLITLNGPDQHDAAGELGEERLMAWKNTKISVDGSRNDRRGLAGPYRPISRNQLNLQCHDLSLLYARQDRRSGELGGLSLDVIDSATHEERLLWQVVELAIGDGVEGRESLREWHR